MKYFFKAICIVFVLFLLWCSIRDFKNSCIDVTDTPECQKLLADPEVLDYVNFHDYWSGGKITQRELEWMRIHYEETQLKSKYNK
jgi:hypothetical protein